MGLHTLPQTRRNHSCAAAGSTKAGHIGAHIVERNLGGVILLGCPAGKEQHIGLDALCIENAGRQAQNGMQIAEIHQFPAHAGTVSGGKQHIIRQHHGAASLAVRLQASIDHLQKVQLLVGGLERDVIPCGTKKGGLVRITSKSFNPLALCARESPNVILAFILCR